MISTVSGLFTRISSTIENRSILQERQVFFIGSDLEIVYYFADFNVNFYKAQRCRNKLNPLFKFLFVILGVNCGENSFFPAHSIPPYSNNIPPTIDSYSDYFSLFFLFLPLPGGRNIFILMPGNRIYFWGDFCSQAV